MGIVAEAIERCISEAVAGNRDYFENLQVEGRPELWLQVRWDAFNVALRSGELPELGSLPPYVEVEEWEPQRFVTFGHDAHSSDELEAFLTVATLACWGEAALRANIQVVGHSRST